MEVILKPLDTSIARHRRPFNSWLSFLLLLFVIPATYAQHKGSNSPLPLSGTPEIIHYTQEDFKGDSQFWSVCEDGDGVLYFGNNDGALVFDGERWHAVKLPNNSSVRSLASDAAGNVYAGGYNEIGRIRKNEYGGYYYESLLETLQLNDRNLENLWQVHILDEVVIYRSFQKLIVISNNKVTLLPAGSAFIRSYVINNQLYVNDHELGIMSLDLKNLQLKKAFAPESYGKEDIVALLPSDSPQTFTGISKSGKIFLFDPAQQQASLIRSVFSENAKDQVVCALQAQDGLFFLGTVSSRIITYDAKRDILSNEENFQKLQDKTVLNLHQNSKGDVWALLNNGLDCIVFNSPISKLFDQASIYDVLIHADKMFVATNQGVFFTENLQGGQNISQRNFQKINGLEGQAWSLHNIDGDILAGHDKGLFRIDGRESSQIGDFGGIWKIIPANGKPGHYLAASYNGLYLVQKAPDGSWKALHKVEGFEESGRDILAVVESPGTYWICHGYKGVYRIKINEDLNRVTALEHYTTQNGFQSPYSINVFRWQNQTVFTSNQGIYTFHEEQNSFIPFAPLNSILDTTINTRKLMEFQDKTWFVQDEEVGYFNTHDPAPKLEKEYFLQLKGTFNRGMECIIPLDSQQVLLGTKFGLYLFNLKYENRRLEVPTVINSVRYMAGQQENHLPLAPRHAVASLPHNTQQLRFEFSAPAMHNDADVQYSYRLDNMDEQWSAWQSSAAQEYSHLRPGKYVFRVKSRDLLGINGQESTYAFEILPVWYQAPWAWALYFLLAAAFISLLVFMIIRKVTHENIKARKEEEKARKLLELELEQMKLQAEKEKITEEKDLLHEDVILKSKELANYTMLLVKKREVLLELEEDLKALRESVKTDASRKKFREAAKKISDQIADEEHLQVFEVNFEKVHHDFFTRLKELYPDLNQKDLRLCAFIKMSLSNKEISPLLNISVRGVETARYRLRKKLNLEHDHNFVEFLESLSQAPSDAR